MTINKNSSSIYFAFIHGIHISVQLKQFIANKIIIAISLCDSFNTGFTTCANYICTLLIQQNRNEMYNVYY